jgi:Do/DeqQ family serine protease
LQTAHAQTIPGSREEIRLSFAPVVKSAAPAVVNIYTSRVVRVESRHSPFLADPFFRQFLGGDSPFGGMVRERMENSLGSGVIVHPSGIIITSHHVIKGSDSIKVVLSDRREFPATVVREDPRIDLALLKIEASGQTFPYLTLRNSDDLQVGDLVMAIGNPFGVGQTVTSGIVSALARTVEGISNYQFFIQTDAAINPGNSGGALVDMSARLVGINTAIFSKSGGSLGIGFAIPSNVVSSFLQRSSQKGQKSSWLGIKVQPVTADMAESLGLDRPVGVLVTEIHPASPAVTAGMKRGDVILKIAGQEIYDHAGLNYRIATSPVGKSLPFEVWRAGKPFSTALTLIAAPESPVRDTRLIKGNTPLTGVEAMNLSPAVAQEVGIDEALTGVVVARVVAGSPAAGLGIRPGDRLLTVNDQKIASTSGLAELMDQRFNAYKIVFQRGPNVMTLLVQ